MRNLLIIFLALAFLYSTGNCQSYETIVDTTKQWSVVTECYSDENYPEILSISTTGYRFRGDTIIDNMHYSFLEECVNDSLFENWGRTSFLFRDDSVGRVYLHDYNHYNQEKLLYNYNVEAGDTISIFDFRDIVDSVGIEVIAGKARKVIYWLGHVLYAKGFGTYYWGPLGLYYYGMVGDCASYVSCFYQNDTLLYQKGENCYVHYNHNSINETKQAKTKIYPNPASDKLIISIDKNIKAEFFLYSIYGRLLETKQLFTNKTTLSLSAYSDGIYHYSIKSGKKIIKNGLLIIKK